MVIFIKKFLFTYVIAYVIIKIKKGKKNGKIYK